MYDDPGTISFNPHHQTPTSQKWGATNLIQKYQKPSTKQEITYSNWRNHHQESMENDAESPRLWKNSPSPSPSPSHPLLFSQNSRAEAIVRGQWELMEMVKNMPESSYELSLKDMVEHQRSIENPGPQSGPDGSAAAGDVSLHQRAVVKVKRDDQGKKIERNLSLENKGLFLNMVFPFSFKSKKKNNSVKVSAKTEGLKGERDWWKRKFRGSSDSDSSRTSNNSGGGSSSSSGGGGSSSGGSSDAGGRYVKYCWKF